MASRRRVALLLAVALVAVLVMADMADAHRRRKKRWKPCAAGKARNYMRCCAKRRCYGTWDPSCPKKGRSCCYVPSKYFWGCCRGKWAAGIYDPACDDDYEWDDDDRPYGRSCASRPPKYLDKCCSEKNPWTDKKACRAWTTGSCKSVSWKYRKQCCYGKWPGTDWYCDYQRWRPDSCASLPPDCRDACCSSKDPWTDPVACKAWLPWGDCRKCSTPWYRYSCCDNKPWGTPGCNHDDWEDHKHGPIVGNTCGSRAPQYRDACCAMLVDPTADPACKSWWPKKNGGGGGGSCKEVDTRYCVQCCLNKASKEDAFCDELLEAKQLSTRAVMAMAIPLADDTATNVTADFGPDGQTSDLAAGDEAAECTQKDFECVDGASYCLQGEVIDCPDGFVCGANGTAPSAGGAQGASQSVCTPGAATPITPTVLDVRAEEPQCSVANYTCVSNVTYCFSGQLVDCAEGFSCSGSEPGCAPVAQPVQPEGQPAGDDTADNGPVFTPCSEDDNTCLADKTGYCLAGLVVVCEDSTQCSGEAGQAACAPSNTTAPPSPAAPNCTEADFTCINGETSYCLQQEQVDCPPEYKCTGNSEAPCIPKDTPAENLTDIIGAPECDSPDFTCVDAGSYCQNKSVVACEGDLVCTNTTSGSNPCTAPTPEATDTTNSTEENNGTACEPNTCIDGTTWCSFEQAPVACDEGDVCNIQEGKPACSAPTAVSPPNDAGAPSPSPDTTGTDTTGTDTGAPSPSPDSGSEAPACEPNSCINSTTWCSFEQAPVACGEGEECNVQEGKPACSLPTTEVSPSPENNGGEVSPSPSPEEEVSPSPSPEEEASPSPSPQQEVSPSPSPEEQTSPSPSPEEEPSPEEASPSPSPEQPLPLEEESPSPSPEEESPSPSPEEESPSPSPEEQASPSPPPEQEASPSPSPEQEVSPSPSPETDVTPEDVPSPSPEASPEAASPSPEPEASPEPACPANSCVDDRTACTADGKTEACPEGQTCAVKDGAAACAAPEPACPANSCINDTTACDADGKELACGTDEKCSVTDGKAACALPAPAFSCTPNSCFNKTSLCSADGLAATNCTGAAEKCFNGTDDIGVCKECDEPDRTCLADPKVQAFCDGGRITKCAEGETCSGSPAVCAAPTTESTSGGDSSGDQPPTEGEEPPEGESPPA